MNSPVQEQRRVKAAQRAAAQRAAADRAAHNRRLQAIFGALGGVLAVILVVTFAVMTVNDKDTSKTAAPAAAPTADQQDPAAGQDPTGADAQPTGPPAKPKLPEGADPALETKPKVEAGTGDLTKLAVTPLIEGKGAPVQAGQQLIVNYVGVTYRDGKEFEASWDKNGPVPVTVGVGGLIKGWDQGLVGVKVGSRVQLDIPSELAYGDDPQGGQPAGPLRFVVDVLDAKAAQ